MTRRPVGRPKLRALLFDVDGTLYDQRPVRRTMLWRLGRFCLTAPVQGASTLRVLRAYRKAQEKLRGSHDIGDVDDSQVRLAADWSGSSPASVRAHVTRWMEREPLDVVGQSRYDGVLEALIMGRRQGLRLGACSDYPATAKLAAMDVAHLFDAVVCAQDPDVQRFKPDPRSLLVTAARLGVRPDEALYVGDRPEVDGVAAERAGMAYANVARRNARVSSPSDSPPRQWCQGLADALEVEVL